MVHYSNGLVWASSTHRYRGIDMVRGRDWVRGKEWVGVGIGPRGAASIVLTRMCEYGFRK